MAEKTLEQLQETISKLKEQAKEKDATIRELATDLKVAEATRGKDAKPIVDINGTKCLVMHAIVMRDPAKPDDRKAVLRLSAKELAQRPDLCAILLEQNSSAIKPAIPTKP